MLLLSAKIDAEDSMLETKLTKVSTTDPDSGYMVRDTKSKVFFYLDHRTLDSRYNIITDVYVTPGNVNDVDSYPIYGCSLTIE